jgi:aminoglycoside phosphotransferase family enzyme/predicted kinase
MYQPEDSQQAVFALLGDPATHGGHAVKRIDTHAASVFLAGERALKVKRALRFPFLDYSTLEKRKAACEAELEVNRAFAPEIYRRVAAITREADGRLALDGTGEPVEWAVEMRRFDEEATLDRLAEQGRIDAALADRLGRAVAAAHAAAPAVDAEPWLEALASFLDQNEAAFRAEGDLFPPDEAAALDRSSRAALARLRPLLLARGRRGLIRRGHGDLHLGNIARIDGRPVLFDAIEFDPLIAAGDVLYDLAFLVMDLIERDLTAAANIVLNRYLAATRRIEDLDGLAALPFFLSLRASIRAKVTAARLHQAAFAGTTAESKRPTVAQAAQTYFRLACRLIEPSASTLVAIGGLSGTGKSVLARALAPDVAPDPGAVILRSDVERKALFALDETDRLPADAYAPEVTAKVYATLADKTRRVVTAGHSAIVDAVFARADERAAIAAVAQARHVSFRGLFLTAGLPTRIARVGTRERDASDADADVAQRQENYEIGTMDWIEIDASDLPEETYGRAMAVLAKPDTEAG